MLGLPDLVQAADLEVVQRSFDKGLVGEVAEKALADMRHHHEEARRLFRGKGSALHNKRLGVKRQVDEIILADNCYKVLKVSLCYISSHPGTRPCV